MTKRVTVSLPDDIAAILDALPTGEVSPFVAEALRRRQQAEDMRVILRRAGHGEYPYDPQGALRRIEAARVPPELAEQTRTALRAEGLAP
jgi:hypothetical protein